MIQPPVRNRHRRQDAYDLYCLIDSRRAQLEQLRNIVKDALVRRAEGRGIVVTRDSLKDSEVERRSKLEYPQLAAEIARPLPKFDTVYRAVRGYYEGMGWG